MSEQQSSRSERLLELGQFGVKELIREPVRESVREALAEERIVAEDEAVRMHRPGDEEQSKNWTRFLRPAVLLPILGLAAAGVIVRRRRLMKLVNEHEVGDQSGKTASPYAPDERKTAGSTSHGGHAEGTGTKE